MASAPSRDTIKFAFWIKKSGRRVMKIISNKRIASSFFNDVITTLGQMPENVYVTEMFNTADNANTGGYYSPNSSTKSYKSISLRTKPFGFSQDAGMSIIFEEFFHGLQFSFENTDFYKYDSPLQGNHLMIEAKVAKLYYTYSYLRSISAPDDQMYSPTTWLRGTMVGDYEGRLMFKDGAINHDVMDYFKAIYEGLNISVEQEQKFRQAVTDWTNATLYEQYKNGHKSMEINPVYRGQTPLFDALIKKEHNRNKSKGKSKRSSGKAKKNQPKF